jgi:glycyl-tRNA synthetase beta chain
MKKKNAKKKPIEKANGLLLEIGMEELPADYLAPASAQLAEDIKKLLEEKRIAFKTIEPFYTVRRFVIYITGLAAKQQDLGYEKKGPRHDIAYKDGKLTDIGKSFLTKNGISEKGLKIKEEKGQKFLFLDIFEKGRPSKDVLAGALPEIIKNLRFPKSMVWDQSYATFARPVRWLLCLSGSETVPFSYGMVKTGNRTRLHKFEDGNKEAQVKDAASYFAAMKKAGIILSQEARIRDIEGKIAALLLKKKFKLLADAGLMEKIAGSVESASAMLGEFDKKYLFLPKEVIITAMREHQRYFAVLLRSGEFTNYFVNIRDGGAGNNPFIVKQHAKVLLSRLSDAEFFFREDLKVPLEANNEKLKQAIFITGLGTMYEKMERLKMLAARASDIFGYGDTVALQMAAYLSKADLMTNMVGEKEYGGLRGFMGGVYLEKQGAEERIWKAVAEHYYPVMAGDRMPSTIEGVFLSLLDKADNMTGFYIAGFKPTGSKDPYAVRRQAMNIIYLTLEKRLNVDLAFLVYENALAYKKQLGRDADINEITAFLKQREVNYFKDKLIDYDIVSAVTAGSRLRVLDDFNKAQVLAEKRKTRKDFNDVVFAVSRVNNILPEDHRGGAVDKQLFDSDAESALCEKFFLNKGGIKGLIEQKKHTECFDFIASFKPEIDRYFDKVLVNAQDEARKNNRLNMLYEIRESFFEFADFSKIVIDRK